MATYLVFHEVDDLEHWLRSTTRQDVFGPFGITGRLFTDPEKTNRVGLLLDIPDFEALQRYLQTDEAAEAMKHDGVRAQTMVILEQASDHI